MMAANDPSNVAPISDQRWEFLLKRLFTTEELVRSDPKLYVAELRGVARLSEHEWQLIVNEETAALRAHRLYTFLISRPSMYGPLKEVLTRAHKHLLRVMDGMMDEYNQKLCRTEEQFKTALRSQRLNIDRLGEWAAPLLWNEREDCISSEEVTELKKEQKTLTDLLTEAGSGRRWIPFLTFLSKEHPDLLRSIDAAVHCRPRDALAMRRRVEELEEEVQRLRANCASAEEEKVRLEERLKATGSRTFTLVNYVTDAGPHVSTICLPVGDGAKSGEIRRAVAQRLGAAASSVLLSRRTVRHDGVEFVHVEDSEYNSFFAGVVVRQWKEMVSLPWLCPAFDDDDVLPQFHGHKLIISATTAPLRPFSVLNEETGFLENKKFFPSCPLRDGGTAGELKTAVGRYMDISPTSLLLSRRACRRDGHLWVNAKTFDWRWHGFVDPTTDRTISFDSADWSWETPRDEDPFPVSPKHYTVIRVKKR